MTLKTEMTLAEASNLANEIHSDDRFVVIAIGRFRLLEELQGPGAAQIRWGISVMARDKPDGRATVWSPEQWTEFRTLALELDIPKQSLQPTEQLPPSRPLAIKVTKTEEQFTLF